MKSTVIESPLLSRSQAAEFLGVCDRTIDKLIAEKALEAIRIGRRVMIRREALGAFISSQKAA